MSDIRIMRILDKSTGDRYFASPVLKEFIAEHIGELIEGQTIRGLAFEGQPKKLRLNTQMQFVLTADEESE